MAIIPRLKLAVLCQHVEFDRERRPYSLIEPLFAAQKPSEEPWPFTPAEMMLYAQLEDAAGEFNFTAEVRNEQNIIIGRTPKPTLIAFASNADRHIMRMGLLFLEP